MVILAMTSITKLPLPFFLGAVIFEALTAAMAAGWFRVLLMPLGRSRAAVTLAGCASAVLTSFGFVVIYSGIIALVDDEPWGALFSMYFDFACFTLSPFILASGMLAGWSASFLAGLERKRS